MNHSWDRMQINTFFSAVQAFGCQSAEFKKSTLNRLEKESKVFKLNFSADFFTGFFIFLLTTATFLQIYILFFVSTPRLPKS